MHKFWGSFETRQTSLSGLAAVGTEKMHQHAHMQAMLTAVVWTDVRLRMRNRIRIRRRLQLLIQRSAEIRKSTLGLMERFAA